MGQSGETYLVGEDLLTCSDSRFADSSTILKVRVDADSVKRALAEIDEDEVLHTVANRRPIIAG
jgi:hypothetical protein